MKIEAETLRQLNVEQIEEKVSEVKAVLAILDRRRTAGTLARTT